MNEPPFFRPKAFREHCYLDLEVKALQTFAVNKCTHAPRLIAMKEGVQDWERPWVPGGWAFFILEEKVPGVVVGEIENFSEVDHRCILASFKAAYK